MNHTWKWLVWDDNHLHTYIQYMAYEQVQGGKTRMMGRNHGQMMQAKELDAEKTTVFFDNYSSLGWIIAKCITFQVIQYLQ